MSGDVSNLRITGSMLYDIEYCAHRPWMDLYADPLRRDPVSPFVEMLWRRGRAHEEATIDVDGTEALNIRVAPHAEREDLTTEAMARREPLIYGGRIAAGDLVGEPDLLRLENDKYIPGDIKSGVGDEEGSPGGERRPKTSYGVQLALYVDVLERKGLSAGRRAFIWNVNGDEVAYDLVVPLGPRSPSIWEAYQGDLSLARNIIHGEADSRPAYSAACKQCRWFTACIEELEATDDLTLIPDLGRSRRQPLLEHVRSISDFAAMPIERFLDEKGQSIIKGLGSDSIRKYHARATLHASGGPQYLKGHPSLPTHRLELFFDIETDPLRNHCYLHGFLERRDRDNASEIYHGFFSDTPTEAGEREAFARAWAYVQSNQPCALYTYSKYERTWWRSLQQRFPDVCSASDVSSLFAAPETVDLYEVVSRNTEWPTRDYSLKTLAKFLGFDWRDQHPSGAASIEWYERFIEGDPDAKQRIFAYNEDDCRATRVLLDGIVSLPHPEQPEQATVKVGTAHLSNRRDVGGMLGLNLREEFKGKRLKGTAIELSNESNTGATQVAAAEFLEITYPTHDLLKGIEAVGPDQGRPVVVIGERGTGKSHLMAALFHAVNDPASTRAWLASWATTLKTPTIGAIPLRDGMRVIGESLHRQRYKFLWDLLFDQHPHGNYIRGKWEGMGDAKTDIPSDQLIFELLRHTPIMLLLDEFQTWYDGLTNTKQFPWKNWAFNFIQILSEIAKEHPDLLALVVSVRNGDTDAYQQIHRVNPVQIDFKDGGNPERIQDRRRMLLHRLFENRMQISPDSIEGLIAVHVAEYLRLLNFPSSDHERKRREFGVAWPFAPHLFQLLEDQVLIATDAQETRDLIRILASLFKSHGDDVPVLTAADFRLEDDGSGIGALLDSVANQQHRALRDKALRNITSVNEAVPNHASQVPHLHEIIGSLWLRSIAVGNMAGAEPVSLQVDITRDHPLDENAFQVELATIVENSFNIHQDGNRLVFREDENPQAKVMAYARNDKLFADGSDFTQLSKEIRYVVGGSEEVARTFRVIALPKSWVTDPWSALEENEQPERWDDRLPILVIPEEVDKIGARLGQWLKDHLQKGRNTVRFLLPRSGSSPIFYDRDLLILARAEMKALEWSSQSPEYRKLHNKYQGELRDILKKRFDRFAVLHRWSFVDPARCEFHVEALKAQGAQVPDAIETAIINDLFVPEDFADLVLAAASENAPVGKLLKELKEPRPGGNDCIPWLGETAIKERILRLCARGKIAINLRGMEYLQALPGEDEEAAWKRLRPKLSFTGRHLDDVFLLLPGAVPASGGASPPKPLGEPPSGGLFGGSNVSYIVPADGNTAGPVDRAPVPTDDAGIFGAGEPKTRTSLANPPTSPLNLIGKLEGWGIGPATPVSQVTIRVSSATGAQLRELLKKLPDGMTFELSLEKSDG